MPFGQVPEEAMIYLGGKKLELVNLLCLEAFKGGGFCTLTLKQFSEKYEKFRDYDNLTRVAKWLRENGWIHFTDAGISVTNFDDPTVNFTVDENLTVKFTVLGENGTVNFTVEGEKTVNSTVPGGNPTVNFTVERGKNVNLPVDEPKTVNSTVQNGDETVKFTVKDCKFYRNENCSYKDLFLEIYNKRDILSLSEFFHDSNKAWYLETVLAGLKILQGSKATLAKQPLWKTSIENAWSNEFYPDDALEVYELLDRVRELKNGNWTIRHDHWEEAIPRIANLRAEVCELESLRAPLSSPNAKTHEEFLADELDRLKTLLEADRKDFVLSELNWFDGDDRKWLEKELGLTEEG